MLPEQVFCCHGSICVPVAQKLHPCAAGLYYSLPSQQ